MPHSGRLYYVPAAFLPLWHAFACMWWGVGTAAAENARALGPHPQQFDRRDAYRS